MYNQKYHQFNDFYNHKFGFHINGGNNGFETAFRLKPKIVKTLELSVDPNRQLRQAIPDLFLIGRLYVDPQDFGQLGGGFSSTRARLRGQEMADKILQLEVNQERHHVNGRPIFHAWESLNEILPEKATADYHRLFDEYQVAFAEKMRVAGFEPIAQNFGTGNGTGEQWLTFYPGTLASYKYLGFHEYDWPTLDRLHTQGVNAGNGGMWLALRYRRIMQEIRQKYGSQHVCIITECGMTQGVQGGQDIGQFATVNTVPGSTVKLPISADAYWQTLLWYNSELMKDDYLMGACLFVTGATAQWETFEHLGPVMERLEAYQQATPAPQPTPTTGDSQMYALNIDLANPKGNPTASQLGDLPVKSVRFTFKDPAGGNQPTASQLQLYRQKVAEYADAGISSLIILTNETLPGNPKSSASDSEWDDYIVRFAQRARQLAEALAQWRPAFQIWNEPDYTAPSTAYDPTLRPAVFGRMLRACHDTIKAVDPNLPIVAAGLASGRPSWLQEVINALGGRLPADAIAWHPYGQRPERNWPDSSWGFGYVGDLIGAYRLVSSLPQWITEIGVNTGGTVAAQDSNQRRYTPLLAPSGGATIASNELQAEYLTRFYAAMVNNFQGAVERVYWFCYADGMVPPFGLLDGSGQPKPSYSAYKNLPPISTPSRRYAVQYANHNAPDTMLTSRTSTVSVTLQNTGNWTWPAMGSNPVRLGYRWLTTDGRQVPVTLWDDIRTPLPFDVAPGQSVTVNANVAAPRLLGPVQLHFDLVEEMVTWFSQKGIPTLKTEVHVRSYSSQEPKISSRVSASHNNVTNGPDNLLNAVDGTASTRWSTQATQQPGMWFQIDLESVQTVSQLRLDNSDSPNDYPRGYRIRLSADGQSWQTVVTKSNNTEQVNVTFNSTKARYIRIEQTGSSDTWWWSIHEVAVTAEIEPTVRASHNNITSGLDNLREAVDGNIYTRWSTRAVQRPGMWFEIDLNETKLVKGLSLDSRRSPNEYPRGYVIRVSQDKQQWKEVASKSQNQLPVDVNFTPELARYIRIEQTGQSNQWWWSIHEFTVKADEISLSAAASHHNVNTGPGNVLQAFDGKIDSRWSSNAPQLAGMWFQVDLNRTRTVKGLRLDTTRSPQNYPRGYLVKVSQDGQHWEEVARNPNNESNLDIDFPPRSARYLRVELTKDAECWWSVHEVVVKYNGGEMSARSSHNNALVGPDNLMQMFDGRFDTRWATRTAQTPGMWVEIDLGATKALKGLLLDNGPAVNDYPRGYAVLVSEDGEQWHEVARRARSEGALNIDFPVKPARYLRVVQVGTARNWWSISEVVVKE